MIKTSAQDPRGAATKAKLIEAAIETLKKVGFAGTSARTIAAAAGCNQALIFYHFGSVPDLLLAALDATSSRRMDTYAAAVEQVDGLGLVDLVPVAAEIYREDLESGHITVLAELIAGSATVDGMAAEITARMRPWIDFTEQIVRRSIPAGVLDQMVSAEDTAYGIVALYLGLEMLAHLDGDRPHQAESLLAAAGRLAGLFAMMFPPIATPAGQPPATDSAEPSPGHGTESEGGDLQ